MEAKRLDTYPLAPGCDFITGGTAVPVIDTGLNVDRRNVREGRVYLSESTLSDYARLLGWISPADFDELARRLAAAQARIDELEDYHRKLDEIRRVIADAGLLSPPTAAVVEPEPDEPDDEPFTGEFPQHQGAGWYLLSDGNKVRGEDEAIAAEAALHDWEGEQ